MNSNLFGGWSDVGLTVSWKEDSPDSTPPARPLRSMQTGQNSIAPENSLLQLGQVRWGSLLMALTALQSPPRPAAIPRSHQVVRNWPARPPSSCCPVARAISCCVILSRQITFRNRIPTAGVLRPPLRWFETSSRTPPIVDFAANRVVCQTFAGYLPSFGALVVLVGTPVLQFLIFAAYGTE